MGAFQAGLILLRIENYPKADELSGVDLLVLTTLFSFAADADRPQAFPSTARVASRCLLAKRTVQRSLAHLEGLGVIAGEHRQRRPTRWSLDPFFSKRTGVTPTPEPSAGTTPPSVTETPEKRHSGANEATRRRQPDDTATHQSTEVRSGAKRRNRTDVPGGATSKRDSAPLVAFAAAPTGRSPAPPGARFHVNGIEINVGTAKP